MDNASENHEAEAPQGLRDLAERHNRWLGGAVQGNLLDTSEPYWEVAAREFNILTPCSDLKWGPLCKERGVYDFRAPDAIVAFAEQHDIAMHGHVLLWHNQNPTWLEEGDFSRESMLALMREHIGTVVGRYRGRIAVWDVVNEAIADNGELRKTLWLDRVGPDYLAHAFRYAHEIDPSVRLLYNDYEIESINPKSDRTYRLVKELLDDGVPIHGLGIQGHMRAGDGKMGTFAENLQRFADLGLELYITEMDVQIADDAGPDAVALQEEAYRTTVEIFFANPAAKGLQTWGFTDKHSWIPGFFKGFGRALLFDESYQPKGAYRAVRDALLAL